MNHAADLIQNERNALLRDIEVMKKMMEAANTAVGNQKDTMVAALLSHNAEMQAVANEVAELKARIKELEG
jgi:hypothetical protein